MAPMSVVMQLALERPAEESARQATLSYVSEAFALAAADGIEAHAVAEVALCAAMRELVAAHGEDNAALIATRLADRAAAGEFSISPRQ